ncbi:hypothetical protein V7122_10630, partial [Bacillus sp. JJ1532]|uniref:hypothetical protein n=1 Tax=Bacillus sp. JJ1532 TaxID=3122958 RepID=UPI002FFD8790
IKGLVEKDVDPDPVTPVESTTTPVTATAVTVGQTLASSTLAGKFEDGQGNEVAGILVWTDETTEVTKTGDYAWTFTPDDTEAFNVVTGTVEVEATPDSEWNLDQVAQAAKTHMEQNESIGTYEDAYPVAVLSYEAGTLKATYTKAALEGYRDYRNGEGGSFDILAGVMNDFARYFKSLNLQGVEAITYGGVEYTWDSTRGGASKYVNNGTTLVSAVVSDFVAEVSAAEGNYTDFTFDPFVFTINGQNLTWVLASSEWEVILNVFHGEKWPLDQVAQAAKTHMEQNESIGTYEDAYPVASLEYAGGTLGTLTARYTKAALEGYRDYRNGEGGSFDILAGVMNDFARYFKSLNLQGVEAITYSGVEYTWDSTRGGASKYVNNGTTLVSAVVSDFVAEVSAAEGNYTDFTFDLFVFTINGQNLAWVLASSEWEVILNVFHGEKWPVVMESLDFGINFVISEYGVVRFV